MGSAYCTDEEIARLKAKCASLTRENERLRERLEVGYYWTSKDGGPLERVPVPESVDIPDGISCRDETIKLQEERITTLTRERDEARELYEACQIEQQAEVVRQTAGWKDTFRLAIYHQAHVGKLLDDAERARDEAVAERDRLRAIAQAAAAYREAESDATPRMWRGKALQDLANALDDALALLVAPVSDAAADPKRSE